MTNPSSRRLILGYALLIVALVCALSGQSVMLAARPTGPDAVALTLKMGLTPLAMWLYGWAIVTAVIGLLLVRPAPAGDLDLPTASPSLTNRLPRIGLAMLGFLACCVATLMVFSGSSRALASTIWLLGWIPMIAVVMPWRPIPLGRAATAFRHYLPTTYILLLLLTVALAYRLPGLTTLPGNIHNDEAAVGLQARTDVSPGAPPLLSIGWAYLPQLGFVYGGLFLRTFGDNLWALRFSSVVAGLLSIVVLYLLARDLFGRRVAVLAAAFLTINHVHVHWSRMGGHYIQPILMVPLTLWLATRSLRTNRPIYYVLTGLALTVSLQVYYAARIDFLLVPVLLAITLAAHRTIVATHWRGVLLALGACLISAAPLLAMIYRDDPGALAGRATDVFLFNTANQAIVQHYVTNPADYRPWSIVWMQVQRIPLIFSTVYDSSLQHPVSAPMTDRFTAALLLLGLVCCVRYLRRPGYGLTLVWFIAVIVFGGVLTTDFPFGPRLSALIPVLGLLPALFLGILWSSAERAFGTVYARMPMLTLCIILLVLAGQENYRIYNVGFTAYPQEQSTTLARYLATLPLHEPIYAWKDAGSLGFDHQAVLFMDPHVVSYAATSPAQLVALQEHHGPGVILLLPNDSADIPALRHSLAITRIEDESNNVGDIQFIALQIGHAAPTHG